MKLIVDELSKNKKGKIVKRLEPDCYGKLLSEECRQCLFLKNCFKIINKRRQS